MGNEQEDFDKKVRESLERNLQVEVSTSGSRVYVSLLWDGATISTTDARLNSGDDY